MNRLRSLSRTQQLIAGGGLAGILLVAVVVAVVALGGDGGVEDTPDARNVPGSDAAVGDFEVTISPEGEYVARLAQVSVVFHEPQPEATREALVSIEPAVGGSYLWLDDRRLVFQPDAPGYERGATYTVRVDAAAEGLTSAAEQSFQVEGVLRIDQVIPGDGDEEVPLEAHILVQFSRAMAPLTVLAAIPDDEVVVFDPPIAGTGEWLNTSVYRFVPDALEPSTEYTATIGSDLVSATGDELPADFAWTFTTVQPDLASSSPPDNTLFVPREQRGRADLQPADGPRVG